MALCLGGSEFKTTTWKMCDDSRDEIGQVQKECWDNFVNIPELSPLGFRLYKLRSSGFLVTIFFPIYNLTDCTKRIDATQKKRQKKIINETLKIQRPCSQ